MVMINKLRDWVPPLFIQMQEGDVINISGSYVTVRFPDGKNSVVNIESVARRLKASERGSGGSGTIVSWYFDGTDNFAVVRADTLKDGKPEYLLIPESWIREKEQRLAIEHR